LQSRKLLCWSRSSVLSLKLEDEAGETAVTIVFLTGPGCWMIIVAVYGKEVPRMAKRTRLVITGNNDEGKSFIVSDGDAPHVRVFERYGGTAVTDLWMTTSMPANNESVEDPGGRDFAIEPPPHGTVFRIVEYPPDRVRLAGLDRDAAFREMGASHAIVKEDARHPGMHRTETLDYAIVLSGEIYAVMDEGEVLLGAGDCLIQRGTNHAWSNRTEEPCLIAFVLIDADPSRG
jgi:mannose-6-phosphate isomerase-like protein (cupin superfamily)